MTLLDITFDGRYFCGWNADAQQRTLHAVLQDALQKTARQNLPLTPPILPVPQLHAVHCWVAWEGTPPENFLYRINRCLPNDLSVRAFRVTEVDFTDIVVHYRYLFHHLPQPFLENRSYHCSETLFQNLDNHQVINVGDVEISVERAACRTVFSLSGMLLTPENALAAISQLLPNCEILPAYALYITQMTAPNLPVIKPTDALNIPEPQWFYH